MMKISASEPVPEEEEDAEEADEEEDEGAVPERKLTCVNLAEGSDYSKLLFTYFMTRTLLCYRHSKANVGGLVLNRNILEK